MKLLGLNLRSWDYNTPILVQPCTNYWKVVLIKKLFLAVVNSDGAFLEYKYLLGITKLPDFTILFWWITLRNRLVSLDSKSKSLYLPGKWILSELFQTTYLKYSIKVSILRRESAFRNSCLSFTQPFSFWCCLI